MKVLDLKKEETKVKREHIQKFGETIYRDSAVNSVSIKVGFKDGTFVGFSRCEGCDELLMLDDEED